MIRINLCDYQEELIRLRIQKQLVWALGVVLVVIILILATWLLQQFRLDTLNAEIDGLERNVAELRPEVLKIQSKQRQQRRMQKIVDGIQKLRLDQMQITRLLSDLNVNLPEEIWLTGIAQKTKAALIKEKVPIIFVEDPKKIKKKNGRGRNAKQDQGPEEFIQISGRVFGSYGDRVVARYVDSLRNIPYFKLVFLHKSEYKLVGTYPTRQFTIYCYMPKKQKKSKT